MDQPGWNGSSSGDALVTAADEDGGGGGGFKEGGEGKDGEEDGGKMELEPSLHADPPTSSAGDKEKTERKNVVLKQLHTLLLETSVMEGKLVCGKCGFEYPINEGVGNFLLPAHLGGFICLLRSLAFLLCWTGLEGWEGESSEAD